MGNVNVVPGLSDITFGKRVVKNFVCGMLDFE
jgi:hypothetical protein